MEPVPFFDVPLNLPHAGRIARRLVTYLHRDGHEHTVAASVAVKLVELLDPYYESDDNPPAADIPGIKEKAAALGRQFVEQVERSRLGEDRLGQGVRNLFECLELGQEGAIISLRAGEDPGSMQRPR